MQGGVARKAHVVVAGNWKDSAFGSEFKGKRGGARSFKSARGGGKNWQTGEVKPTELAKKRRKGWMREEERKKNRGGSNHIREKWRAGGGW